MKFHLKDIFSFYAHRSYNSDGKVDLFNKYLLSTWYALDTILGIWDTVNMRQHTILTEIHCSEEDHHHTFGYVYPKQKVEVL